MSEIREGEIALPFDPADEAGPLVAFIGKVRSPWEKGTAPGNLAGARERGGEFAIVLDPRYQQGLEGLSVGRHIIVMYWMDRGRRDLIVQCPRHTNGPRGVFSLRSPVRPNPIALATVKITSIKGNRIGIDAIDCFDGTPVVDIKPWIATIDQPQDGVQC
ncbi:tRNA (N6-threonylcarbamoyladenosine(37)-N6)-methyltransferase TrmO [Aliiroseovarius sp. KMU-50]|uniref:tRNA (N6-threonylcarbamoyladenosine(37)-N6)-methyltransferase TrmO n=1 Tax=Aliiroseovarius salicola TaxID=3009082 RepID=A0ABT4W4K1_9RHOB|nr:tRNA (N6-threonylcarbamoyladenosine(37)-N6)-methyltransferase TrmO [Aliiroseovarius sp. KMU-50]MDA5095446.1 tRNA (N6-threonylcarbamoyladenosine(37)-N6)-methyltransferase TrmO [Aliiroseovarius sp. KMU-50]